VRNNAFDWIGPIVVTGTTVSATVSLVSAVGYSAHEVANTTSNCRWSVPTSDPGTL